MRANTTKLTSLSNLSRRNPRFRFVAGVLSVLTILAVAWSADDTAALADSSTDPELVEFNYEPLEPGTSWRIYGQVANHDGTDTVIEFGDYLAGESTNTDSTGYFDYYVFAPEGETISATAKTMYGTSETKSLTLILAAY